MKFFQYSHDGGVLSRVTGFFFVELKSLFSIVLLRFGDGSREAFHSHAFNACSWVLSGKLIESRLEADTVNHQSFLPSFWPVFTTRDNCHKVTSVGTTWVLSFRGPWAKEWYEIDENGDRVTLTHGRKVVAREPYVGQAVL